MRKEKYNFNISFGNESPTYKWNKVFWHEFQGEFKTIRPPNFNWESEEASEAWLLNMERYFHIYNYSSNLKCRLALY